MSKKWYNVFVSTDAPSGESALTDEAGQSSDAARTVAQIAASVPTEPTFSAPVQNPTSFDEIYQAAEIQPPPSGYTIEKVATMLASEHLRGLSADIKRNSILVALEASGAKIEDVIQDAIHRDRALDSYERVLRKSLTDVQAKKADENRQIEAEMNKMLSEYRARIQANNEALAKESERFSTWLTQKQQEEKSIADAVSYFVSQNPITVSGAAAVPAGGAKTAAS
jgi:Asp-tRNA(Asn)/Glu-tRNA(Gln) amidotransferase A subunit family amidase